MRQQCFLGGIIEKTWTWFYYFNVTCIPLGLVFKNMVCRFVWLWFVFVLLVCKFVGVGFCEKTLKNWCWNGVEILRCSIEKLAKIIQHPSQNWAKTIPDRRKCDIEAFSAPNRAQAGPKEASRRRLGSIFSQLWPEMSLEALILVPPWIPKCFQNHTVEHMMGPMPSKNALPEGVRKKHEHLMKIRCENQGFLIAQNHVWRYTLCL